MKCTSIRRVDVVNLQQNYQGMLGDCVVAFNADCKTMNATWGHLLDEQDGKILAMYSKTYGLQVGSSRRSSFNQCDEG